MCLPVSFATFLRTPFIEHPRWLFGIVYFSVFPAVNVGTHAYLWATLFFNSTSVLLKGAEATCVKISTEMKKCSRLKEMSNFDVLWNFQPIWTCFSIIILEIRNQLSSLVIPRKFMLPFWNPQKLTIFFRTTKSTLAGSLKLHGIS